MARTWVVLTAFFAFMALSIHETDGAVPTETQRKINELNKNGPYLGLVIPNSFEMNPLLQSSYYVPSDTTPYIDVAGRRFRFGTIEKKKVILVMTGLSMEVRNSSCSPEDQLAALYMMILGSQINAGITTQLLLTLFRVEGVVHYGIAGNANPSLNIGDVTIPQYWAHTGLWNWQRYGDGPDNELALEGNGDYTREIGFIKFSDYNVHGGKINGLSDNLLNSVWYQPEEVFPIDGTPEERQHAFWIPVDPTYFAIAKKLESMKLQNCLNSTTCLTHAPKVLRVARGVSASIYLDNAAYRSFIYKKFNVSPVEMESASVALICTQQKVPFIVIRALSDLAGGGSAESNEADTFAPLAATNSVEVVVEMIKNLNAPKINPKASA